MKNSELNAAHLNDETAAQDWYEKQRWPEGIVCIKCGCADNKIYTLGKGKKTTRRVYLCGVCKEKFSLTKGTIFEDSKIPLHKWFQAAHLLCSSKKGMTSHQLHRILGITYKSAWYLSHRIRECMARDESQNSAAFGGQDQVVEVDETYYGMRKHRNRKEGKAKNQKVVTLVEREGKVRSYHVDRVNAATVKGLIRKNVQKDTHVMTDDSNIYGGLWKEYKHDSVNHGNWQYVKKAKKGSTDKIHTNTVEGFFGTLKRGLVGNYQWVSPTHLHRYIGEFDFRYNNREVTDAERAAVAVRQAEGKRLMYHTR
jgi:transposase-like protein